MTQTEIRAALTDLATSELRYEGPLPAGDLADQFDSVQRLTFVVAIEDRFRICFSPEDEAKLITLDDLIRAIQQKLEIPEEPLPDSH